MSPARAMVFEAWKAGPTRLAPRYTAELELSAATVVVGREAEMDQAAAGVLVADWARVRDSAIGLLVTREFHG
jgi:hypothetical protein